MNYYAWKMRAPRSHWFSPHMSNRYLWQLKKSKSRGLFCSYIPAKQQCQSSPFTSKLGQMGWFSYAIYLVAPKQPQGFWFFSIAMVAGCLCDVKNMDIWIPAFFKYNNSFIATVSGQGATMEFRYFWAMYQLVLRPSAKKLPNWFSHMYIYLSLQACPSFSTVT